MCVCVCVCVCLRFRKVKGGRLFVRHAKAIHLTYTPKRPMDNTEPHELTIFSYKNRSSGEFPIHQHSMQVSAPLNSRPACCSGSPIKGVL